MQQTTLEMVVVDPKTDIVLYEKIAKYIKRYIENLSWSPDELESLIKQIQLDLRYKLINELPIDIFYEFKNLQSIDLSNNLIRKLPHNLLIKLNFLKQIDFSYNQLDYLPDDLFNEKYNLEWVNFSYNQIFEIPSKLFRHNKNILKILFINNQIEELPGDLFKELYKLEWIDFSGNQLVTISKDLLHDLPGLRGINFGSNQITYLPDDLFKEKCLFNLRGVYFNNNLLTGIPGDFFDGLYNLSAINFSQNQLYYLGKDLFRNLLNLELLDFSNNELSYLPNSLFKDLIHLETINFSFNQLDCLPNNILKNNRNLTSVKFSNNKIDSINYNLLKLYHFEQLSLDLRDNIDIYDFDSIYNLFFYLNKTETLDSIEKEEISKHIEINNHKITDIQSLNSDICISFFNNDDLFLLRHKDTQVLNQRLFVFYLSKSYTNLNSIFDDFFKSSSELNCLINKSFEVRIRKLNDYKWSILDFLVHFEDFNNHIISNLIKHVDMNLKQNKSIINIEFKLRSSESVVALCERNDSVLFNQLFPSDLVADFIQNNDTNRLKSINNFVWTTLKDPNMLDFYLQIDYCECFNIVIRKRNEKIAIQLISLIKMIIVIEVMQSKKSLQDMKNDPKYYGLLIKFNTVFLDKYLKEIIDLSWYKFIEQVLYYAKDDNFLDLTQNCLISLTSNLTFKKVFSKTLTKNRVYPDDKKLACKENNDILKLISKNPIKDSIMQHETTKILIENKWNYLPKFHYYLNLIIYLTFLTFYSINIELFKTKLSKQSDVKPLESTSNIISIILIFYFFLIDFINLIDFFFSMEKTVITKLFVIEFINKSLCLTALFLNDEYYLKSSFYSLTILIAYFQLFFRLKMLSLMGIGKLISLFSLIIKRYLKVILLIFILYLGFLISFRNQSKIGENSSNSLFNQTSFELSLFKLINIDLYQLGLSDSIDKYNSVNYILFSCFLLFILLIIFFILNGVKIQENWETIFLINKIEYIYLYEDYVLKYKNIRDKDSYAKKMFYLIIGSYLITVDYAIKYLMNGLNSTIKSFKHAIKPSNEEIIINFKNQRDNYKNDHILQHCDLVDEHHLAVMMSQLTLILNRLKKVDNIDKRLKIFEKYKLKRREKKLIRLDKISKKLENIDERLNKIKL